ncbi:MAG: bifunctional oligoribonuclease/PAP phosphatase NrnA [Bacillota bacterium]|nr:bifunctional oligoribonuclease/PAP phosphatase NrnA [Bacillota bacterium]
MSSKLNPEVIAYGKTYKATYKKIYQAIEKFDRIAVFRHIKPDFDAMGSQMGVYQFLRDNFPNKEVHYLGDNHVSFTPRLFPETENLNNEWFDKPFLAIVVDVGDVERIADPRFQKAAYTVKIDHHPCKSEIAPDCTVCDESAASAAEICADVLLNWKGKVLSREAARHFYIGVVGDSGRFLYSSVSRHTFAVAEELLKTGIGISDIYLSMYEKTLHSLEIQGYILNHFKVSEHGVAYYTLSTEQQAELGIVSEQGKENVNLFSNIEGINVWCSITQDKGAKVPCWWISIRSKKADISHIANKWGGGGHPQASGAKLLDIADLDAFIKDLDDLFK